MVSIAQSALVALPSLTCLVVSVLVGLTTAVINFVATSAMVFFSGVEGSKDNQGPLNNQNNNNPNDRTVTFVSLEAARAFESLVDSALPSPETGVLDLEAVVAWLSPTKEWDGADVEALASYAVSLLPKFMYTSSPNPTFDRVETPQLQLLAQAEAVVHKPLGFASSPSLPGTINSPW
jgi:hypothetical protein